MNFANHCVDNGPIGSELRSNRVGKVDGVLLGRTHRPKLEQQSRHRVADKRGQRQLGAGTVAARHQIQAPVH